MSVMDGLQAVERILKDHPAIKVIGMTGFDEEPTILDLLNIGVHGVLLKRSTNQMELTTAINDVMDGKNYFNTDIRKVGDKNMHQLNNPFRTRFTPREWVHPKLPLSQYRKQKYRPDGHTRQLKEVLKGFH